VNALKSSDPERPNNIRAANVSVEAAYFKNMEVFVYEFYPYGAHPVA
jgi:hypothetical protein